MSEPFSIGNWL